MSRAILSAVGVGSLLNVLVLAPIPSRAQYDLATCTGNYNYCLEQSRRTGQSRAQCEGAYQQCMRSGTVYDPYNRRPVPLDRR